MIAEYFSDINTATDSVPQGDRARQAVDSLRGYAYQILATTLAWLNLDENDQLHIEVAEDYAVIAEQTLNAVQIKDTKKSRSVTLNSEDVRKVITSYVYLVEKNPDVQVYLHFFTTSKIGIERGIDDRPGGVAGLEYWRKVAAGADPLLLRKILESNRFPESVREFSRDRDDIALRNELIGRIHWHCGEPDFSILRQELEKCLISMGRNQFGLAAPEALKLVDYLLCWVLKKSIADEPRNRILTQADLYQVIDAATRVSVPRALVDNFIRHATGMAGSHSEEVGFDGFLSTKKINWLIEGAALPALKGVIPRIAIESETTDILENYGVGILVGGSGVGKSTVSRMVAIARVGTFFIVDFRNASVDETRHRLDIFFARMAKLPISALIFEDLDHLDDTLVALSLARVMEASRRHNHEVLITCHRKPSSSGLTKIGLNKNCAVVCPDFSEEETCALVRESGGNPNVWGRLAYVVGGFGHPQLVYAFVVGMAAREWPVEEISDILSCGFSSEDIDATRDTARRSLVDALPEQARNLLYRLSLAVGPFDRALALTVGKTFSSTAQVGEHIDQLVGPWVEPVGNDRFRISPLAKDFGREMLTLDEQQRTHKIIAAQMFDREVVNPSDFNTIMIHALVGKSPDVLLRLAISILSAGSSVCEVLAEHLFPFRLFQTNTPIYPEDPLTSGMLRLLQFKLAMAAGEGEKASKIASALFTEINNVPDGEHRQAFEVMALTHVLCTLDVANYLDNWIMLLTRFKSMAETSDLLRGVVVSVEGTIDGVDSSFYGELFCVGSAHLFTVERLENIINELDNLDAEEREFWLAPRRLSLSDYSVFINSPWAMQPNQEVFDPEDAVSRYQRMAEKTRHWGIRALSLQCSVAQAVVLDEYQDNREGAIATLNEAIATQGNDFILSRALAKVYLRDGEHEMAHNIFLSIADEVSCNDPVERAYALRDAAISAAKCSEWSRAAKWFLDAQDAARQTQSGDMPVMAIGLGADAAVAFLMRGDGDRSLTCLAEAIEALENIDPEATLNAAHCHRIVRHTVLWVLSRMAGDDVKINGRPIAIEAGHCSNPEPLPAIRERPLGHVDITWYMLAEAEIAAGIDVGITSTLEDRLQQGLIPGMEINLRLQKTQKDIDRLDAVGFVNHFMEYVEVSVFLSQNVAQGKALCDPLDPERGTIPVLDKNPPFDPVAECAARDAILAFGICSSFENQPEAMTELKTAMENYLADPFLGKSVFDYWDGSSTSPTDLEQTVASIVKVLLKNEHVPPRNFCIAGLRLFEWIVRSNFQGLLINRLATWQRFGWKRILAREAFRLSMPRQIAPLIREILAISENDKSFVAKLFLVTSDAVEISLEPEYRDSLEAMTESKEQT